MTGNTITVDKTLSDKRKARRKCGSCGRFIKAGMPRKIGVMGYDYLHIECYIALRQSHE